MTLVILVIAALVIYGIYDNVTDPDRQIYQFDRLHYDVTIESDGTASVLETRDYTFERGRFTFGWFELAEEATDIQVLESGRLYERLDAFSSIRTPDTFAALPVDGSYRVEWYYSVQSPEKRTFEIAYRIPAAAIAYEDSVVYFQKYLSETNEARIGEVSVTVHLPAGSTEENTLIWGHGPVTGQIEFADKQTVRMIVPDIRANQMVEARFLLPADSLTQATAQTGKQYDEVLAEETAAAQRADRDHLITQISFILGILILLALLIILLAYYRMHRDRFKPLQPIEAPLYLRDVPAPTALPVIARLHRFYHKQPATSELISLTILDLIRRRVLRVQEQVNGDKPTTWLHLAPVETGEYTVAEHEIPILDYLFRDVAPGQSAVSLDQFKRYSRSARNQDELSALIHRFEKTFNDQWKDLNYEDTDRAATPKIILIHRGISFALSLIGFLMLLLGQKGPLMLTGLLLLTGGFILFLLSVFLYRKRQLLTQKGENERARWLALERFFNDFSAFDEKDLPEVGLWADLLLVATALTAADRVLKQLKMRYPDAESPIWRYQQGAYLYGTYYQRNVGRSTSGLPSLQSTINQAMHQAQSIVTRFEASQGGGGGFSGGGGGGGGGAGGSSGGGMG